MKYGNYNNEYIAYYNVIVKSRGTITVSANPSGGTVSTGTKVTITPSVSGSTIYYTTDGYSPTTASTVYSSASGVIVDKNMTLKARAVKDGYESEVSTWDYKVTPAIEINATNFPDDNFRNYLLQNYYGKDGKLTEDEIKNIRYLTINDQGISSLQGIEYFTALTSLWCYNNQLTTLDVSKNTALTTLWCYNNQLTTLDVSKNTALTTLWCNTNQLTTLDVSKNTALTTLYCYNNQLTALDVSKNTALTELRCYTNQLTVLDVSRNTALTLLSCHTNPLTALDVSKNIALTKLWCYKNQLTALDVSRNIALTLLSCWDNQLTALDVSKNIALTYLYCYGNQLTAFDVSKNITLTTLHCYNNQIKGASMDNLINSLPINNTDEPFVLRVYSPLSSDEGNVCTKKQVQSAREKGWKVYYEYDYDENGYGLWKEYEGSDDTPSGINDIRTEAGKDAPIYNLRGQRLTAPQKGINIIGGRKVVVK